MRKVRDVDALVKLVLQRVVAGIKRSIGALVPQQIANPERSQLFSQRVQLSRRRLWRKAALDQTLARVVREPRRAFEASPPIGRDCDAGFAKQVLGERRRRQIESAGDGR